MPRKPKVIDLIDHYELLLLFSRYVDQCIEEYTHKNKVRPLSFDEWYEREYKPNKESLTQIVSVVIRSEEASGGQLFGGYVEEKCQILIPAEILTESGGIVDEKGFFRMGKKLTRKTNHRLPQVLYRGKRVYHWAAD